MDWLLDAIGDQNYLCLGGAVIGLIFGACAQRSQFCLRSATLEVAHGHPGRRLSIWLFTFSTALIATQILYLLGLFDSASVRQLNNRGSLSGAIIGGLMFGGGMVLTRACASRMLVLSANGNLRALLSGLVFAVAARAAKDGMLSPLRTALNDLWTIDSAHRDLLALTGIGRWGGLIFGCLWMILALVIACARKSLDRTCLYSLGVGLTVALAWWFTFTASGLSFELVPVQAISFTSPSSELLMFVLSPPGGSLSFDLGLIPGVALGSFLAALAASELKLEGFNNGLSMFRYIAGGCLMGFGGVLAGGCAVGAGVSGASIFAVTAWIVLWSMWLGAVFVDYLMDSRHIYAGRLNAVGGQGCI